MTEFTLLYFSQVKESSMILLQTVPTHIQLQELEQRLLVKVRCIICFLLQNGLF